MKDVLLFLVGTAFGILITALVSANKYDERDGHP